MNGETRRFVASIIGLLGVMILIDIALISMVSPGTSYDGFRQVLFVIIGALLVVSGAITFTWPSRGRVESKEQNHE